MTRVIERVGSILGAFTAERGALTLTECVAATGLNKSSVLRLLVSLEEIGLVERIDSRWRLGPEIVSLAMIRRESVNLQREVVPVMRRLREEFGMSVAFSVPDRHEMLYLERLDSADAVGLSARLGARAQMWEGASGLAVLSRLSPQARERALDTDAWRGLSKRAQATIMGEVEAAAERGYALYLHPQSSIPIGGAAIAPCSLLGEPVAALSVIVMLDRFDEPMQKRIGEGLLHAARSLRSITV